MTIEQALFRLHEGLPRNSPGSEQSTLKALRRLGRLPRNARAIDLGCGNGASTIVLARRLSTEVVAVDAHEPFLRALAERAKSEELKASLVTRHADFSALDDPPASYDLLWSEGAAYVLGFETALVQWQPLLKRGGRAAITELSWIGEHPSTEAKEYWSSVYPGMRTIVGNCAAAERAGYSVIDTMTLTNKDWNAYYNPMKQRILALRSEGELSPEMAVIIEEAEREIAIYEKHGDEFGYIFYLLEKQGGDDAAEDFSEQGDSDASDDGESFEDEVPASGLASSRHGGSRPVSSRSRHAFDDEIAPVDSSAHRAAEARFTEAVAELGLDRATALLDAIRERVADAIAKGK